MTRIDKKKFTERMKDWKDEKFIPFLKEKFDNMKNKNYMISEKYYKLNQIKDNNYQNTFLDQAII